MIWGQAFHNISNSSLRKTLEGERFQLEFVFNLNLNLILITLGWLEKLLIMFCTLSKEIFDRNGPSNSSRESVTDWKYELKIFAIKMFSVKISLFSFKVIFQSPNGYLLEKYGLQLFEKSFEPKKGIKLSKCPFLDWFFNLTTLRCFLYFKMPLGSLVLFAFFWVENVS